MPSNKDDLARVVVTGVGPDGRSRVVSDGPVTLWTRRPTGIQPMSLWRVDSLPTSVDDDSSAGDELVVAPPGQGLNIVTTIFPPDSSISPEAAAAYAAAMADIYGAQGDDENSAPAVPGMHSTETVDVMTVIFGEICCVMEEGEVVLHAGDTVVQRGTRHAWRNRTDQPTTVVTVMMAAARASTSVTGPTVAR